MADDLLLQALGQQRKQFQDNNLWSQGGDVLGAFSQGMMKNPDESNPNDSLIAALVSGLGSGMAKGYGQSQVRQQMADYSNVLGNVAKDLYSGGDMSQYYNSPYQSISEAAPALKFQQMANQYERQQKSRDSLISKGLQPTFDNAGNISSTLAMPGYGEAEAQNSLPKTLLDSKLGLDSDLRKLNYQSQLKQQELGLVDPKEQRKEVVANEDKLRNELYTKGNVAQFDTVNQIFNSVVHSSTIGTKQADLDMVLGLAKITDPPGVVRQSDSEMIASTGGVGGYLQNLQSQILGGQGLTPEVRKGLLQIGSQRRDEFLNTYNDRLKETANVLKLRGGDINTVDVYGHFPRSEDVLNPVPYAPGKVPTITPYDQSMFNQAPQAQGPMVQIRSKSTGQMMSVPQSQLSNYGLR